MSAKIYTKTGDNGITSLFGGKRFSKSDAVFDVLGGLDELNSFLGLCQTIKSTNITKLLKPIQSDLFEFGSVIAGYKVEKNWSEKIGAKILELEKNIDLIDSKNKPLKNFILPGGSYVSSHLHLARAVCRRTERVVVRSLKFTKIQDVEIIQKYLNRLSDYLFVLARFYNKKGISDILWNVNRINQIK